MLKQWLIDNGFLAADAKDVDVDAAAQKALDEKKLTLAQYLSLKAEKSPEEKIAEERQQFAKSITDGILTGLAKLLKLEAQDPAPVKTPKEEAPAVDLDAKIQEAVSKALQGRNEDHKVEQVFKLASTIHDEKHPDTIRVKRAAERFSDTKTARLYTKGAKAGQPMVLECRGNKGVDMPSDLDNALMHAWFKFQVAPDKLTEHDKDLLVYTVETKTFVNTDRDRVEPRKLTGDEVAYWKHLINTGRKAALLDDTTSGGEYAVPEFFDTNAVLVPLNDMELTPFVRVIEVPRGSSAHTYSMGLFSTVSTAEGTSITTFDATSLLGDHDVDFFPASCFVEIGKDWLSDATPRVGADIQYQMSRTFGAWADEQVAVGDGTTEPQGIMNAPGTVAVASMNGMTGPLDIIDLVNLFFGVDKAHRYNYERSRLRFGMTDTTFKRFKSLQTGVTNDDRLLFGNDMSEYSLLGVGVGTPYSGMTNSQIFFCQMGGYRWYRRQGVQFGSDDSGSTLRLKNTMLVWARTRNGGKLDRGAYAAVMTSAQS